jgi:hypothetical protein
MAPHDQGAFRFLYLPAELRLIIYKFLTIHVRHHTVYTTKPSVAKPEDEHPSVTIILHQVSVQLLRVCHKIRNEAQAIMTLQVERIRERTPRIIVDSGAVHLLSQKAGILTHATYWLEALRADEGTDFDDWVRHRELQVPDEVLCFIRQAGIQMSAQWQKLEVVKLPFSRGRPASLFLACRIRTSPWHVFGATFKQGLGPWPSFIHHIASEGRKYMSESLQVLYSCRYISTVRSSPYPLGGSEMVIIWSVEVEPEQGIQVKGRRITIPGLWDHLDMNRGWKAGEEME